MKSWTALTLLVQQRFEKRSSPFQVTIGKPGKTWKQLAFLHDAILPAYTEIRFNQGHIKRNNETDGKYDLKALNNYGEWIDYNGGKVFVPDSFEDADIEALSRVIDWALDYCALNGVYIEAKK